MNEEPEVEEEQAEFTIDELEPSARERALQAIADHETDGSFEWWGCIYEDAKTDGNERGFEIKNIYFSGFWSQGDGACWTGSVELTPFIAYYQLEEQDPRYTILLELLNEGFVDNYAAIEHRGHYSHDGGMYVANGINYEYNGGVLREGSLAGAGTDTLMDASHIQDLLNELEECVLEKAREYARKIYRDLEAECDYLTDEEHCVELARELGMVFDEEGDAI